MPDPITRVDSFHLAIPSVYGGPPPKRDAQWTKIELALIRVETRAGFAGWGEAFGHRVCSTTCAALRTLIAPAAIGLDSDNIAGVSTQLRRLLHTYGLDGPIGFGLSGLDIALWDIRGQRERVPIHRLLNPESVGGSVPAYASLLRYDDPDMAGRAAADAARRGHRAVKLHEANVEAVIAAREAAGPDVRLSLDVNCRWSVGEAIAAARHLESTALNWIEEPCWPATAESLAAFSAASSIPVAAGENAGSLENLEHIAIAGGITYLQPSAAKLGGLSGLLAARDIAARLAVHLAPHSAYFGFGLAATLHFCAAFGLDCEWYDCRLDQSPSGLLPEGGRLTVPDMPGLGIAIPPDLIDRYEVTHGASFPS